MPTAHDGARHADEPVQVVILAAGMGTRLGRPAPKPLTLLAGGRSIMAHQLDGIRAVFGSAARTTAVVGFKKDLIMDAFPWLLFSYNERFDATNTAVSLLRALRASSPGGVLWLNGDVVFDPRLLATLRPHIRAERSFVCVNTAAVGVEEIKYTVDPGGLVAQLSKTVADGIGEAVGINYIGAADKALFIEHLARCADTDYFERGLELAIDDGLLLHPVDISEFDAVEVDFPDDLDRANAQTLAHLHRTGLGPRLVAPRTAGSAGLLPDGSRPEGRSF